MEKHTTTPKTPRTNSRLRLTVNALIAVVAVFVMALMPLPLISGDNVADGVLGEIDFGHNGINNTNATSLDSPGQMAIDLGSTPTHLYVVDTVNSRVLGWNDATSYANGQAADLEIGQPDFETTLCNSGGVSASSLCMPVGVAVDSSGDLYVADTQNNRVLLYDPPFGQGISTGFSASFVIGQNSSFTQNVCAQGSTGLCNPQGVALDPSNMESFIVYVADSGNNRVLEYNLGGGATASLVFGQGASGTDFTDFNCGPASAIGMCTPLSVTVDSLGDLYVGDSGENRVLEFNQPLATPDILIGAGDVTADLVLGQGSTGTDFTDTICYDGNNGDPAPSADGICGSSALALDSTGDLFVTDTGNSRTLEYLEPLATGGGNPGTPGTDGDVTADNVFGQGGSFITGVCGGTAASGIPPAGSVLCLPDGVTVDALNDVFVADTSNNRVLKYVSPESSPPVASLVLGEMDLVHGGVNNPTAAALQQPSGVAIDSNSTPNHLYVADSVNNRILGWANAAGFANDQPADIVIGQPDALSINCKDGTAGGDTGGVGPDSLCNPVDVAVDGSGNLYVADASDDRVLEYPTPFAGSSPEFGLSATQVWGQADFTHTLCNFGSGTLNGMSLCFPEGVTVDTLGDLLRLRYTQQSRARV